MTIPTGRTALLLLIAGIITACEASTTGPATDGATFDGMRSVGEQYEPGSEAD